MLVFMIKLYGIYYTYCYSLCNYYHIPNINKSVVTSYTLLCSCDELIMCARDIFERAKAYDKHCISNCLPSPYVSFIAYKASPYVSFIAYKAFPHVGFIAYKASPMLVSLHIRHPPMLVSLHIRHRPVSFIAYKASFILICQKCVSTCKQSSYPFKF